MRLFSDEAVAEFEITEVSQSFTAFGSGSLRTLYPLTSKSVRTEIVRIRFPELVWQDLHEDLMLWELPNGISPGRKRRDDRDEDELGDDPEDKEKKEYPSSEVWGQIHIEIDARINSGRLNARGQKAKLAKDIDSILAERGLRAGESTIKRRINKRIAYVRKLKDRQIGSFGS